MKLKSMKPWLPILLALNSSSIFALGLYVPYQSAADMGDARAGTAAVARDASTNFANAAGLTRFSKPQFVFSAIASFPYYDFSGTMSNPGFGSPIVQSGKATSNLSGLIPAFHYVQPLTDKAAFGISLIVPSGLGFDYSPNSVLRYEVVRTTLATTSLTPSLAYRVTPKFSVALGPDFLYSVEKSKVMVRTQPFSVMDSSSVGYASGIDYAWHAGLLYEFTPQTRVGFSYRSRATLHLYGQSRFFSKSAVLPARNSSDNFKNVIPLASLYALSAYHEINSKWVAEATAEFMNWSVYRSNKAYNVASPLGGTVDVTTPMNLKNTWFYGVGGSFKPDDQWIIRAGLSIALGATNNGNRQIILPDPNAFIIAAGFHYQAIPTIGLDFGANHSFFQAVKIDYTNPATSDHLTGRLSSGQTSLGLQVNWDIA